MGPEITIRRDLPVGFVFAFFAKVAEDPLGFVKESLTVGPNVNWTIGSESDDGCR